MPKTKSKPQTTWVYVRREGPNLLAVHIAGDKVVMAPCFARDLAGKLLRGAARLDPDFRDKP